MQLATPFAAPPEHGKAPAEGEGLTHDALVQQQQQQQQQQQLQQQEAHLEHSTPASLWALVQEASHAFVLRNVPLCIMYLPSHAFFTMCVPPIEHSLCALHKITRFQRVRPLLTVTVM